MNAVDAKCPIWGTECEDFGPVSGRRNRNVNSSRAGGNYIITLDACRVVEGFSELEKAKLSRWIYQQNQWRNTPVTIDADIVGEVRQWPTSTVMERIDYLLQFGELKTRESIGTPIAHSDEMLAATVALDDRELDYLIRQAKKMGLVAVEDATNPCARGYPDIKEITVRGYQRLEDLNKAQPNSDQAFVAMWFHDDTKSAWENGFKPAINDAGYKPVRIDKEEFIDKIDDQIIAEIRHSRFVVADFTSSEGPRGGVYYEAGFARGMRIPVIFTCHRDAVEDLHFDTRQYNHIRWGTPDDLREQLKNRILAVIGEGQHQRKDGE